jgi:hypothetical protein
MACKRFSKSSSYGRMQIIITVNYKRCTVHKKIVLLCIKYVCTNPVVTMSSGLSVEKIGSHIQQLISIRFQLCALQVQS